ncbi:hypothetical protein DFJ58DRAFT_774448 [Suillus subalutaceus]|uniref:uncharacterized protein n=1 Tax=Suillus subalutaceus TaxID=48586 RepID=UPI001B877505|nr:uncharacterized protein DFJ58DRAFT_774448 [Suillus subalutaceus]KAG1863217.1 hypothetical protein DFJ58DRAFT_774448 [Suillus subalutaceus]
MPLTTVMTLPAMYSKLPMTPGSKGWLPKSPSNTTTLIASPARCVPLQAEQLQKPAESTITLPTDRQLPDKQVLAHLKAAIQARLDLTDDNQASLSLEHCAIILEALQNPQSNTIVIVGITPAEYAAVLAFTSEEKAFEVRAKFAYFENTQELQIMPPLPVHEQPAAHLSKAINKFTDALPYDKLLVDVTVHLNHRIQNKDTTNIPDLHLAVTTQPPEDDGADEIEIPKPVSKWVGECGLSSDHDFMVRKLRVTCDGHRDIDLALIMSFKERFGWQQPKKTSIAAQTLRTVPVLEYEEFVPARIKKNLKFGPVTIHSHVWIDISEIRYSVFRRGADGHFNFNSKNPDTFAEGTLYPTVHMSDVERMLRDGANALKEYIVSLMQGMSLEASAIQLVRESNPIFEPVWGAAINQISSAIYLTAYCRYLDWRNHKYSKRKISQTAQSSSTGDQTTASISSVPTLASSSNPTLASSDPTVCSSAGLSLDMQPEPLAKKAKTKAAEEPRRSRRRRRRRQTERGRGSRDSRLELYIIEDCSTSSLLCNRHRSRLHAVMATLNIPANICVLVGSFASDYSSITTSAHCIAYV